MVKAIYISSTLPKAGKTALCIGLLLKFKKEGLKVGYLKPIGNPHLASDEIDADVRTIAQILEVEPQKVNSPVLINKDMYFEEIGLQTPAKIIANIKASYQDISSGKDVVLLEGSSEIHYLHSSGLDDVSLAKELGAKIVIIDPVRTDSTIDDILATIDFINQHQAQALGVILNDTSRDMMERAKTIYKKKLKEAKISVLGIIPQVPRLLAPTVHEIVEALAADVLEPGKKGALDRLVEGFVVGAMSLAAALQYLRRAPPNTAVITGGDRADIALVALEQEISALIFTGNIAPGVQILAKAKEKGVPVMLSRVDTYGTVHLLEKAKAEIQPAEQDFCLKMVEENVDIQALLK